MSENTSPKRREAARVARMPKTYYGVFGGPLTWSLLVEQGGVRQHVALRLDLCNHSPDGVAWGYPGSGPAQCALALLADLLQDDRRALRLYQRFKVDYISRFERSDNWALSDSEVLRWAAAVEGEMAQRRDSGHVAEVVPLLGCFI